MVLLHGFASDSRINWVRPGIAGAIADEGWRAVLLDARGHGRSQKPHDANAYRGAAMVRDVRELLDHLGVDEVAVVGYSMGSFVAIRFAVSDPRVRALVLGGAGGQDASISSPPRSTLIAEALEAVDKSAVTDPTALAFRNFAEATGADRLALAAVQRARSGAPSVDVMAQIAVPTLVINGEKDVLAGPPESLARSIPGAQAMTVPGDHISAVVKPEFTQAMVEFLSKR